MTGLPQGLHGGRVPSTIGMKPRWRHVFKLEDFLWLKNYRIQGQSVVPASIICVSALAVAMDMRNEKKVNSIELADVTLEQSVILEGPALEFDISLSVADLVNPNVEGIDGVETEFNIEVSGAANHNIPTIAKILLRVNFAGQIHSTD